MPASPGRVVLAATPIGNTADAAPRLVAALEGSDVVAAEDTRRIVALARRLGIVMNGRLVSLHEHNEEARTEALLDQAREGASVLVVSDAGMPTVSDPGYRLVRAAVAAQVPVTTIPGPSAVLAALAVSGLPTDRFCFEGFAPRKPGALRNYLAGLAGEQRTMVFFEAARRLADTLAAMAQAWGPDRAAVVARELTKEHEEVRRGPLAELAQWAASHEVLGEVTLVVAGVTRGAGDMSTALARVLDAVAEGERLKEACGRVAGEAGVSSRELYAAAIAAKQAGAPS